MERLAGQLFGPSHSLVWHALEQIEPCFLSGLSGATHLDDDTVSFVLGQLEGAGLVSVSRPLMEYRRVQFDDGYIRRVLRHDRTGLIA